MSCCSSLGSGELHSPSPVQHGQRGRCAFSIAPSKSAMYLRRASIMSSTVSLCFCTWISCSRNILADVYIVYTSTSGFTSLNTSNAPQEEHHNDFSPCTIIQDKAPVHVGQGLS